MLIDYKALVKCPLCKAKAGDYCKGKSEDAAFIAPDGKTFSHGARVRAALVLVQD